MTADNLPLDYLQDFSHFNELANGLREQCQNILIPLAKEQELHACFYCDGGAKPYPPMAGWGMHGYFFTPVEPKQGNGCSDTITDIGYTKKEGQKVTPLSYVDGCGAIPGGTNNAAETQAVLIGLLLGLQSQTKSISFFCDSKYVLSGCTERLERMRQSNFMDTQTRLPIPNAELWKVASVLIAECEKQGIVLKWNWVKGHSDNLGNNKADLLASKGITLGRNNHFHEMITLSPAKGYWNPVADYDRFLNEGRWFFQMSEVVETREDTRHVYYLGNSSMDDMDHGVPSGTAGFAVVRTPTQDPVLKAVEEHSRKLRPVMMNEIIVGRLDMLFNPTNYTGIVKGGVDHLYMKNPRRLDLWVSDKIALTQEISPPRKSYIVATTFRELEMLLIDAEAVLAGQTDRQVVLTEITNCIYEEQSSAKKKVMKVSPAIDNGDGVIKVSVGNPLNTDMVEIHLSIGIDTPKRNMLAAIADENAQVFVVTWKESAHAFRYGVLVKACERIGLWAAVYSNLRIIV